MTDEFQTVLSNGHDLVEEIVRTYYRKRALSMVVVIIAFATFPFLMTMTWSTYLLLAIAYIAIIVLFLNMIWLDRKKDWLEPNRKRWAGDYFNMYYWRSYFREAINANPKHGTFHTVSDMFYFQMDLAKMFKDMKNSIIAYSFLGLISILNIYLLIDAVSISLSLAWWIMLITEISIFMTMRKKMAGTINRLEQFNRDVNAFWEKFW